MAKIVNSYRVSLLKEIHAKYGNTLSFSAPDTYKTLEQLTEMNVYGLDRVRDVCGVHGVIVCKLLNGRRYVVQYCGYTAIRGMFSVVVEYTDEERAQLNKGV